MGVVFFAMAAVIGILVFMGVLSPLLQSVKGLSNKVEPLRKYEKLLFEKERLLENLSDLELDHELKKMDEAVYQDLKAQLLSEAATIYMSIEKFEKESPLLKGIEKDLASLDHQS